jgi:abortive infection bacteriophage resistance protein
MKPSRHNPNKSNYDDFRAKLDEQIMGSGEDFAKHFRTKYNAAAPVWVAIELWDFGTLSRFFQLMITEDREQIAGEFGLPGGRMLGGWIQSINVVRNICAHHGRLNRRHLPEAMRFPKSHGDQTFRHLLSLPDRDKHRLYPVLCGLITLLRRVDPETTWHEDVVSNFSQVSSISGLRLADYGVPDQWEQEVIWRSSQNATTAPA